MRNTLLTSQICIEGAQKSEKNNNLHTLLLNKK